MHSHVLSVRHRMFNSASLELQKALRTAIDSAKEALTDQAKYITEQMTTDYVQMFEKQCREVFESLGPVRAEILEIIEGSGFVTDRAADSVKHETIDDI